MIGQFRYSANPPDGAIAVSMSWVDGNRTGTVLMSPEARDLAISQNAPVLAEGEQLALPMAVGFAVAMAMMGETTFYLTGDRSAWPPDWGRIVSSH